MLTFLGMIFGYIAGSLCSAIIISKLCQLPDPRTAGSHNPGATNVLRLAGKKYAAIVLLADLLKGLLPVVIAKLFGASFHTQAFIGFAAVLGHMYPIFFQFKGGKGVATALGVLLGLNILMGLCAVVTWLLVAGLTRYSSLASVLTMIVAPLFSLVILQHQHTFMPLLFMSVLILYQHRQNLVRLFDGQEPKINFSRK